MLADARGFYQRLLVCLIDRRFRGNVAGFTRAPGAAGFHVMGSAMHGNHQLAVLGFLGRDTSQGAHFGELNSPRAVANMLWRITSSHH
jgi:hypothetical protein